MKIRFHYRILILPILVLLWSALVPHVASGEESIVISETKLVNSENESAKDKFGYAVAVDSRAVLVGAYLDGLDDSGSAYLFEHTDSQNGNDFPQTKLTENDDDQSKNRFGNSLDISGDTLVLGAYFDDINGTHSGSAHVMRVVYDGTSPPWTISEQTKLTPREPSAGDEFGYAVAISGNTVVVGAHKNEAVYVFNYDGSGWDEIAKLTASDGQGGERFGSSVAVDGDIIVVGAIYGRDVDSQTGSVYVFKYNGSDWVEETELFAADLGEGDQFGCSVAVEGDTIIVGARLHDGGQADSGAAYVFRRSAATWIEEAKLTGFGLSAGARFGNSVALSGSTAVVGAYKNDIPAEDNTLMEDAGSAYVFRFNGSAWPQKAELIASDAAAGDEFGCAVDISGELVLVGAHEDDGLDSEAIVMLDAGSAYIFTLVPENERPFAIVGDNQEVEEGTLVTLKGSDSYDPDFDLLSYAWTQIGNPEVTLDDPTKADPTFTAPAWPGENLTLTFQLVVNDGREDSDPALVEITVLQSTKSVTEISSVLGWKHRPWGIDKDIYTFHGTQGQQVTVALRARSGGKNNNGNCATLKLKDNIRGISFYRVDSGRLPNKICATLPATGEYHILVAGQPRFFRGKRFLGEYTLTLEGVSTGLEKGAGSSVDHEKSVCPDKPHKEHPIWNWIFSRFRH